MKTRERLMIPKRIAGINKPMLYEVSVTKKEDNLENDHGFLSELIEFLLNKGISYRIMYYLLILKNVISKLDEPYPEMVFLLNL